MQGKLMDDIKTALSAALSKLDPDDSFSIIAFNGEIFSTSMELASKDTVERAIEWIKVNFVAEGATNILHPIKKAMDMLSGVQGSIPIILLVTDGSVMDERHICDIVKKNMINEESICPRIYTFGIATLKQNQFLEKRHKTSRTKSTSKTVLDDKRTIMTEEGSAKYKFCVWKPEEDDVLVASLLQIHEEGGLLAENGFKPGVLKLLHAMLHEKIPGCDLKIHPNIQSRLKTLKLNWQVVNDLVNGTNTSGFGWDPKKKCVTAKNAVWDEYLKSNKKAAQFRGKPFPHFDALCTIFAKDRATGQGSLASLEADLVDNTEENPHVGVDDNEDAPHVDPDIDTDPSFAGTNGDASVALTGSKKRRRNSRDRDDVFLEALEKMMNNTCEGLQTASKNLGSSLQKMERASLLDAKREVLCEELSKLEELTENELEDALLKIIKDEELLVIFPTLPYARKLSMVRRLLA